MNNTEPKYISLGCLQRQEIDMSGYSLMVEVKGEVYTLDVDKRITATKESDMLDIIKKINSDRKRYLKLKETLTAYELGKIFTNFNVLSYTPKQLTYSVGYEYRYALLDEYSSLVAESDMTLDQLKEVLLDRYDIGWGRDDWKLLDEDGSLVFEM